MEDLEKISRTHSVANRPGQGRKRKLDKKQEQEVIKKAKRERTLHRSHEVCQKSSMNLYQLKQSVALGVCSRQ
jgi:transposase